LLFGKKYDVANQHVGPKNNSLFAFWNSNNHIYPHRNTTSYPVAFWKSFKRFWVGKSL